MNLVNYRTYQLIKENEVVMETQAATFDRAIDYFYDIHPQAYSNSDYTFKVVKMPHER